MIAKPHVGLLVTCLVDIFRPQIGFACIKLLENANCKVVVPLQQTCCGQPAYNNGDFEDTKAIAIQVINAFENFEYVVVPSGSCAGMIRKHYPELFKNEPNLFKRACDFSNRTFELICFLADILKVEKIHAENDHTVTYHDACSGLRELGIEKQPRHFLKQVKGLTFNELPNREECCGFGGTFCVKYPAISNKMVEDKVKCIQQTNANILLAGDLGCLLNIAGKLQRLNSNIQVFHIAELLANMTSNPGIGEGMSSHDTL